MDHPVTNETKIAGTGCIIVLFLSSKARLLSIYRSVPSLYYGLVFFIFSYILVYRVCVCVCVYIYNECFFDTLYLHVSVRCIHIYLYYNEIILGTKLLQVF